MESPILFTKTPLNEEQKDRLNSLLDTIPELNWKVLTKSGCIAGGAALYVYDKKLDMDSVGDIDVFRFCKFFDGNEPRKSDLDFFHDRKVQVIETQFRGYEDLLIHFDNCMNQCAIDLETMTFVCSTAFHKCVETRYVGWINVRGCTEMRIGKIKAKGYKSNVSKKFLARIGRSYTYWPEPYWIYFLEENDDEDDEEDSPKTKKIKESLIEDSDSEDEY